MSTDADIYLKGDRPTMEELYSINIVQQLSAACTTIKSTWKHLGFELGLTGHDLIEIERSYSNVEHRCSEMLTLWIHRQSDASWEALRKGLIDVGLEQLANMISQQLSENTSPTTDTRGSIIYQKHLVKSLQELPQPSQGASTPMSQVKDTDPVLAANETESLVVVSKEEFQRCTINEAFVILCTRLYRLLKKTNYASLKRACIIQTHIPSGVELPQKLIIQIQQTQNLDDLFDLLSCSPYWNWIDIRLMEAMVTVAENSLAHMLLDNYKAAVYSVRLIEVLPITANRAVREDICTKISAKLMKDPKEMTIADLLMYRTIFEQMIMNIQKGILIFKHVDRGCVEIHWYIPTSFVDKAYQNARTRHYQFNDLCLLYLKIGHYPVILNQTGVISTPNASVDVATDDFKRCVNGVQDDPLDTRTIQIIARHLTNWEQLAPHLQLTGTDMEEIKRDYPTYREQKYQCIMIWASKNGKARTIINPLWHIYFDLNDKSLVIKIVEDLKRKDVDKTSVAQIGHIAIATAGRKQTLDLFPQLIINS